MGLRDDIKKSYETMYKYDKYYQSRYPSVVEWCAQEILKRNTVLIEKIREMILEYEKDISQGTDNETSYQSWKSSLVEYKEILAMLEADK